MVLSSGICASGISKILAIIKPPFHKYTRIRRFGNNLLAIGIGKNWINLGMAKSNQKKKEDPVKLKTSFEELFNMSTNYVPKNSVVNKKEKPKPKKAPKKK